MVFLSTQMLNPLLNYFEIESHVYQLLLLYCVKKAKTHNQTSQN